MFALFVVSVFWGLMSDCFSNNQGRRLFATLAVGSSIGAMTGSTITANLADWVPTFALLLIACIPLEMASWCALVLHRRFATGDVQGENEKDRAIGGTAWDGMKAVASSPFLMGIALFISS